MQTMMCNMKQTRWWAYLSDLMGDETATEAAKKSKISSSNFTRWKKGARADPDFVVKIARAYKVNVLQALVEAEFITDEEASLTEVAPEIDLTKVDGHDLIDELERRVEVLRYLESLKAPKDQLAAKRSKKQNHVVPPAWDGVGMPPDAVADDSPEVGGSLDDLDP